MFNPKLSRGWWVSPLIVLVSCGVSETNLRSTVSDPRLPNEPDVSLGEAEEGGRSKNELLDVVPPSWVRVGPNSRSAAFQVEEREDRSAIQETFWFGDGATTGLVDYLFVVDDSISMHNIIESFSRGFEQLSKSDTFPLNARIAVMNMTPGNPRNLKRRHPVVPLRAGAEHSPGFLRLVDKDGIERFNMFSLDNGEQALRFDGCSAWFKPDASNAQGVSCLVAHTQLALQPSVAEAGLTAFHQLLERDRSRQVFREGAAVNVVMVSDTHDPGFVPAQVDGRREEWFQELLDIQPSFDDLKSLAESKYLVSSFRVHAIAPRSDCSEHWIEHLDPVYFDVAQASGGVVADSCEVSDYSQVIRQIVDEGSRIQAAVFPLSVGRGRAQVENVFLGEKALSWTLSSSGRAVIVNDEIRGEKSELRIQYRVDATRPGREGQLGEPIRSRQAR